MEANNGEIDPYIQIIPIGESDNSESSDLLTGLQSSTNSRTDILPENSSETTVLHDSEAINSESFHSVASQKTSLLLETDPISQQGSCDDSQGVDDAYTDDSNSMTWEHFHQSVLNLRAKTDQGETNGSYSLNDERSFGTDYSSCAIGGPMNGSAEINVDNDQPIDAVNMDQSFEGDDDLEFVWEDYLQQTGATAVPPSAFKHVEHSLQSGFIKGMKLEVPNKSDPSTYWVASVQMTCGPLLRLRYDGYGDESSADFWCDLATTEVHHIGWSAQTGKNLQPPDELKDSVSDWRTFLLESLTGARTAPLSFLEKGAGTSPVDQLKCGMKLELQDILNPLQVWLVQILENVGGRLYLRLEGTQSASKHFWMFYLDPRLHPIGWVNDQEGCIYRPPPDIYDEQTDESWTAFLQTALKECEDDLVPDDIFKEQQQLKCHQFTVGMKLEALNPGRNTIGPATVTKVINNKYFIVELDDVRHLQDRVQICCNTEYLGIFPISWCQCKGIRLTPPRGWSGGDFVWGEYLSICSAKAAPERLFNSGTDEHDFERGMKLEAVNPDTSSPNQICAATITKIVGPLLWIHLDHMRDIPSHIEDIDSHNLFPVGWCESNHYQLKPPVKAKPRQKHTAECKTEEVYRSITSCQTKGAWCPKIFFNHRCFSGPYLSKGRISDLPKHVGPGPMHLVLREVLSLLIGIAYVPCRALKEIQHDGAFNPNMKAQILKAKYKGKRYKAVVEVCQRESQLEEYCRNMCIKLECCPYIFSPLYVRHNCPENCQQLVKSKSSSSHGRKRKHSNFTSVKQNRCDNKNGEPKKRGRKRRRFLYMHRKGHRHDNASGDMLRDEGFIDYDEEDGIMTTERRRYDIQTRGAKLPKYSFEKKSHRKILMSQSAVHVNKPKQGFKRLLPKTWSFDEKPQRLLKPRQNSLKLKSNPLLWSMADVVHFLKATDCSHLARILKEQEVDGQAFMLLNLTTIQEHLNLKLGPAVKLCHQIENLKIAFYESYA